MTAYASWLSSFPLKRFNSICNSRSHIFNPKHLAYSTVTPASSNWCHAATHLFSCERVTLCDTQRGGSNKSLFIYLKLRKAELHGAKSLNTTILFHGGCWPFPPFCAFEVDLKSLLVLLIWGWVRPICHLVRRGKSGGADFNCQVTRCRDGGSFGHIVCLCMKGPVI